MPTEMMKAVRVHRHGPPENLAFEDVPKPTAGVGEILVRNLAAGVNFADIDTRRNNYPLQPPLPHILGSEFAGVVEALGAGVTGVAVGDRVFGIVPPLPPTGYAQYVVTSADTAFALPPEIGFAESTALLIQGVTAYLLLRDGVRLAAGDSVLMMAAAGGVGSLAVQLADIMGAGQIIGAASTPAKRRYASSLGAHATVDYTRSDWSEQVRVATGGPGVDAALVNVGGSGLQEALASLAPFGRLSVFGSADAAHPAVHFDAEFRAGRLTGNQTLGFFTLYPYQHDSAGLGAVVAELTRLYRAGHLAVKLGPQLPLSQAAQAHRLIENRDTTGKMVLLPWAD